MHQAEEPSSDTARHRMEKTAFDTERQKIEDWYSTAVDHDAMENDYMARL